MYFKFVCPSCDKSLKVREEYIGKRSRCPHCKSTVTITAPPVEEPEEDDSLSQLAAAASGGDDSQRDPAPTQRSAPSAVPVAQAKPTQSTSEPEQGGSQSSGTDVNQLISLLIALVFTVLLYTALFLAARDSYFGELFLSRGWVPYVLTLLMGWSGGILILKWFKLRKQQESMFFDLLPTDLGDEINVKNTPMFARQIRELPNDARQTFLINRVLRGLEHFRVRRNTQEVANVLSSQSDIDATSVQSSYTIIKVFIWAIPILGFIGTVIGIGDSVGSFASTMESADDVAKLKDSLSGVTDGLGTAFDTTLLALVMSLLVMFPTSAMQKAEEDLLNWVDEYCNENLLKRLKDASDLEEGEIAKQVRRSVDAAMDKHHAAFTAAAMMLEKTSGRGSELADQVAELQQTHLERIKELSEAMDRQDAALQSRLLNNAQVTEQYLGSVSDGLIKLDEILAKLEGRQVVVQQQKRGWFGRKSSNYSTSNGSQSGDGEA